jgi:hypothetical protein
MNPRRLDQIYTPLLVDAEHLSEFQTGPTGLYAMDENAGTPLMPFGSAGISDQSGQPASIQSTMV